MECETKEVIYSVEARCEGCGPASCHEVANRRADIRWCFDVEYLEATQSRLGCLTVDRCCTVENGKSLVVVCSVHTSTLGDRGCACMRKPVRCSKGWKAGGASLLDLAKYWRCSWTGHLHMNLRRACRRPRALRMRIVTLVFGQSQDDHSEIHFFLSAQFVSLGF